MPFTVSAFSIYSCFLFICGGMV